eukprot:comp20688_c0_seq1/m.42384 comp20688_c0_seq1/g.42384  ORF comp20688_c0_seq1/g.42384 comp20688_c0_seq1/m.42384 type:complete len:141 (-) comp20688_c0_seq1:817-1239(-)
MIMAMTVTVMTPVMMTTAMAMMMTSMMPVKTRTLSQLFSSYVADLINGVRRRHLDLNIASHCRRHSDRDWRCFFPGFLCFALLFANRSSSNFGLSPCFFSSASLVFTNNLGSGFCDLGDRELKFQNRHLKSLIELRQALL